MLETVESLPAIIVGGVEPSSNRILGTAEARPSTVLKTVEPPSMLETVEPLLAIIVGAVKPSSIILVGTVEPPSVLGTVELLPAIVVETNDSPPAAVL